MTKKKFCYKTKNYSLDKTLLSGQAFRWYPQKGGFTGVLGDSVVQLRQNEDEISAEVIAGSITHEEIADFLQLEIKYDNIIKNIIKDPAVAKSIAANTGFRILKQDPYETVISFIDSANNSIPNIRAQIKRLSSMFGKNITGQYYQFPSASEIDLAEEKELRKAKVGFRAKYMKSAAKKITTSSILDNLESMSSPDAVEKLKSIHGVGSKIADCILLFGYSRMERVPVDTWTRQIAVKVYGLDPKMKYEEISDWFINRFGEHTGYASSFLFEAARQGVLF